MNETYRTEVDTGIFPHPISHRDHLFLTGSCFADHISRMLLRARFNVFANPHGILFNPESLASSLHDVMNKRVFETTDLIEQNGIWHSMGHHGSFSHRNPQTVCDGVNASVASAHEFLKETKVLFVTFGSAWAYRLLSTGKIVANCHKIPQREFKRELLSVEQIVATWKRLIGDLQRFNPNLEIVLTVSPVRHWRDGATGNQLSKATLILAVHQLIASFSHVSYFPAYEIVIDELRDYRFFKEDMLHPSDMAIQHVWRKFTFWILNEDARRLLVKLEPLLRFLEHTPMHVSADEHAEMRVKKESEILQLIKSQ